MHPSLFFFNDTATTEIYTLSLHDALPIYYHAIAPFVFLENLVSLSDNVFVGGYVLKDDDPCETLSHEGERSEEHTSELQSLRHLVCRLLLEKKKKQQQQKAHYQPQPQYIQ